MTSCAKRFILRLSDSQAHEPSLEDLQKLESEGWKRVLLYIEGVDRNWSYKGEFLMMSSSQQAQQRVIRVVCLADDMNLSFDKDDNLVEDLSKIKLIDADLMTWEDCKEELEEDM